ncbi:hypothetical protein ACHAWF_006883 [Thalassiosira exigua]
MGLERAVPSDQNGRSRKRNRRAAAKFLFLAGTLSSFLFSFRKMEAIDLGLPEEGDDLPGNVRTRGGVEPTRGMSSCLLFMDDNHHLPEWIGYHYFALSMRHLVIAVDPASRTQPKIHPKWKALGVDVTIWSDGDYILYGDLRRKEGESVQEMREKHKTRQGTFYQECSRHLRERNRTWTTYHDVDEFLTVSREYFQAPRAPFAKATGGNDNLTIFRGDVVADPRSYVRRPGHVPRLLEEARAASHPDLSRVCVHVPRALYGAVESPESHLAPDYPEWIDPDRFDTLRFRHRLTPQGGRDGLGKGLIDVSLLTEDDLRSGGRTHSPIVSACGGGEKFRNYGTLPLGIHHYLGSWESYSFRQDARAGWLRSYDIWLEQSTKQEGGKDDEICSWAKGFEKEVGESAARELLRDAGLPKSIFYNFTAFSSGSFTKGM